MGASEHKESGFLPGALIVGAVLAILGVGMILSTDAPRESRAVRAQSPPLAAPVSAASPAEDAPAAEEPPPPAASDLASRVGADLQRLGQRHVPHVFLLRVADAPRPVAGEHIIGRVLRDGVGIGDSSRRVAIVLDVGGRGPDGRIEGGAAAGRGQAEP